MSTNMVIVPQELLDKLREARGALYAMYPNNIEEIDTPTLMKLVEISEPMYMLANTKWEKYKP